MIDKLFFIILILNATGLFSFIAAQLGVSIGQVSLAMLGMIVAYITFKMRYLLLIIRQQGMGVWLIVLLIWPLFTILYAPSLETREIGLQVYFYILFLGTCLYTVSNRLCAIRRVVAISLMITIFGLVMSLIVPQFFASTSALADAEALQEGRASGFLLQPNQLAICINILFIGWFAIRKNKNPLIEVATIIAFLISILLTGSRTGILAAAIVVLFILIAFWKRKTERGKTVIKTGLLIICIIGGAIGVKSFLSQTEITDTRKEDLISRIEMLLEFRLSDERDLKNDESLRQRALGQRVYWSLIKKKPIIGYGFGSDVFFKQVGSIELSAHSDVLTTSLEYGVLYPFLFGISMIHLYRSKNRKYVEKIFRTNSVKQFIFITMSMYAIASILELRTFYIVLGIFYAVLYFPGYVFCWNEGTRRNDGK